MTTLIRPSQASDVRRLTAIYAHHVVHGSGSFELIAPDENEMVRRRTAVLDNGQPFLVAEVDGAVMGYAYANLFRPRPAYRYLVENSVYIDHAAQRLSLGRALMAELIQRCEAQGARQMIAVIGDSANLGSIRLHQSLGFEQVGLIRSSGWKHQRWLDTVMMQRPLGLGDLTTPTTETP
jgi:phosphinothricin acetyltransferase